MSADCCQAAPWLRRSLFLVLVAVVIAIPIAGVMRIVSRDDAEERGLSFDTEAPAATAPATTRPHADPAKQPGPRAEYGPDQVVQIVMDALQNNDDHDAGIVTTFNFASPGNKRLTGPVERFIPMVRSAAYRSMLNFRSAEFGEMKLSKDKQSAEQTVTLISTDGESVSFIFHLSKQTDGEFKGCWMTDGVVRAPAKGPQA
jgi:hypothetical protein